MNDKLEKHFSDVFHSEKKLLRTNNSLIRPSLEKRGEEIQVSVIAYIETLKIQWHSDA